MILKITMIIVLMKYQQSIKKGTTVLKIAISIKTIMIKITKTEIK